MSSKMVGLSVLINSGFSESYFYTLYCYIMLKPIIQRIILLAPGDFSHYGPGDFDQFQPNEKAKPSFICAILELPTARERSAMKDTATNYEEETRVLEAIEAMKSEAGPAFSFAAINLAELERRTGVSRSKLRRLKRNGFEFKPHGNKGRTAQRTVLTGYTEALDAMLRSGIANSSICLERLREAGYSGGASAIKGLHCCSPRPYSCQASTCSSAGKPWPSIYDAARRSVSDGLGLCESTGLSG